MFKGFNKYNFSKNSFQDFIKNDTLSSIGNPMNVGTPICWFESDEMQTYYDLYNSIYNEKDLKYATNPFKQDDGFPAMAQDYNIIKPYVDQLLGEETKRPFNFHPQRK